MAAEMFSKTVLVDCLALRSAMPRTIAHARMPMKLPFMSASTGLEKMLVTSVRSTAPMPSGEAATSSGGVASWMSTGKAKLTSTAMNAERIVDTM